MRENKNMKVRQSDEKFLTMDFKAVCFATMFALAIALLISLPSVSAVNDPGHDSLYIIRTGDSVVGNFSILGFLNATIYYDKDSATYYLDPSGTTNLNTLTLNTDLAVAQGGTGAGDAATARTNLLAAGNGTCAAGSVVQNATTSGVQCVSVVSAETGDISGVSVTSPALYGGGTTGAVTITFNTTWADANYVGQSEYVNLDTDSTNDLTTASTWSGGDLSGTGLAATIAANAVALTTDTSGNYVGDVAAGNGLTKSSAAGEGQSVDLAVGAGTCITVGADSVGVTDASCKTNWDAAYTHVTTDVIETAADVQGAETDPQVGTLTSGNFCKGTGTAVSCTDSSTYLTTETGDISGVSVTSPALYGGGATGAVTITFNTTWADATYVNEGQDDDTPDSDAEVPNAITVTGGTIGSNNIESGATWSTLGQLTIGDDGDAVVISASNWDVSNAGVITLGGDAAISRTAQDVVGLASGDSLNIVLGGLQVAGTEVISSLRMLKAANGTNTTPAVTFSADTNTGFYLPSADNVGIATAGSQRVGVSASGINILTGNLTFTDDLALGDRYVGFLPESVGAASDLILQGAWAPGGARVGNVIINGGVDEEGSGTGGSVTINPGSGGTDGNIVIAQSDGNVQIGGPAHLTNVDVYGSIRLNTTGSAPACSSSTRGTMWITQGASNVADKLYMCMKNATNAYNYVQIAIG